MIIGLTGYARHGKDTVGEVLVEHGFQRAAFADKVREFALAADPIIHCENSGLGLPLFRPLSEVVGKIGWDEAKKMPIVRQLLQQIGTDAGRRVIGEDVWVNALMGGIHQSKNYVITDVRFPNEVTAIHAAGGIVWRIHRPNFDNGVPEHESERYISTLDIDHIIINDEDVAALQQRAAEALFFKLGDSRLNYANHLGIPLHV